MVQSKIAADEVSFERSHLRISSTDSKVRITLMFPQLTLGVKGLTVELNLTYHI